jgi:mono/diheme cytochrome c family protein
MVRLALLTIAVAVSASSSTRADMTKGQMLAAQLCAGCHAIRPGQMSPKPDAPPFASIVAKDSYNIFSLRSFLRTPHWTSANLSLKPDDNEAIASYIMTLQPKR